MMVKNVAVIATVVCALSAPAFADDAEKSAYCVTLEGTSQKARSREAQTLGRCQRHPCPSVLLGFARFLRRLS
jgi:hypothetical protein